MAASLPFEVTATKNIDGGYDETFCLRCVNDYETVDVDSYWIKQVMNCGNKFSANSPTIPVFLHDLGSPV